MRRIACCLLALFTFAACAEEVTGPEPQMAHGPDDLATDPSFVCNEDPGTWITLHGDAFSPLVIDAIASEREHDVELPTVHLFLRTDPTGEEAEESFDITLESPLGTDDGDIRWIDDETLQFRVTDELELPEGVYDITVENPNGGMTTEHEVVGVLPRPTLEAAIPEMTCIAQGTREVTLEGRDLLIDGNDFPTVHIDDQSYEVVDADGCLDLHDVFGDHQLCDEATAVIDEDTLDAGTYDVVIENLAPADCTSRPEEDDVTLTIADPPEVNNVQPSPICAEQLDYEAVEIDGEGFITLDNEGVLPAVTIGSQTYTPESVDGCDDIDEAPSMGARECSQLTVFVAAGDLAGDVDDDEFITHVDVQVENPDPVGCHSIEDVTLGLTPPPTITSVAPRAACNNDGTVDYVVTGDHLLEIDGESPTIVVDGAEYDTDVAECTDIDGEENTRGCEELHVAIDLEGDQLEGAHAMVAVNPEPAACSSGESEEFYAAGPPVISDAEPDGFCADATFDGELELFGQFLNDPEGSDEYGDVVVEVDGEVVDFTLDGCAPVVDGHDLELCGSIDPDITSDLLDDLEEGDFDVTVTDALSCGAQTFTLHRTDPPTVDSVIPQRVCSDGSTFTVNGSDLHEDAEAFLDGEPADEVVVSADGTSADVTFGSGLSTGTATFEFVNPGDCGSEYDEQIRVTDGPLPIFVDPPVVFDQMQTRVTIYAAGLFGGQIDQVELLHPDGTTTTPLIDPDIDDNVVRATIPEEMLDEIDESDFNDDGTSADFGIRLTDDEITCSNEAEDLVTITEELTLAVDDIDPPFGSTLESTAVEITAVEDIDAGETQFEATPRAYLNPSDTSVGTTARELQAVQFIDETRLNGVVPSGLSVGDYDVIVVNPDGAVGVLDAAYEVTEEHAPRVDSVSPASWPNDDGALAVDIDGEYFRDDPDNPDVEVFCQDSEDDTTDEDLLDQPNSITVDSVTDAQIQVTVDTTNLAPLMACYMRVTNPDGTFDEYWPITVTNPAQKFIEFAAGAAFDTARRAPVALAGSPTRRARYLYVVGGDDGDASNAYATGEVSRLNRFGAPVQWSYLPFELPEGRTLADGVVLDDFVYIVGGDDGDGATDEVLRAQVLDPLDVPSITNVDVDVEDLLDGGASGGLDAGTYYYRVSAVYADDDPANPEGESLASEPQPIQLPVDGTEITIFWDPPPGANHEVEEYRVYRNVEPDDPYGDETLIATVDSGTSFTDDGSLTPGVDTDDEQPLAQGSLGTWHQVATLNVPRSELGVTVAPHPDEDGEYFIYAVGGVDDGGTTRADYEIIDVIVDGARQQDVFDATVGEHDLPQAQSRHQTVTATGKNADSVAGQPPQIFNIAGTGGNAVYAASVGTDGDLGQWSTASTITSASKHGHAAEAINDNLALVGGHNGAPSTQEMHAEIQCGGGGGCPPASTSGWESLSDTNMTERVTMGDIAFGGFWYLTGGLTSGDVPSNTVDFSVAGATP